MHKNVIVCLCVGPVYSDQYVRTLKEMVDRHTTVEYDFICYSDRTIEGIRTITINDPERFDPVWYKLQLQTLPEICAYHNKVFFDLDVVIHSNIDWLFELPEPGLHVIRAEWKTPTEINTYNGTGCNSSIMAWRDDISCVYSQFLQSPDKFMMIYKGIDRFLWNNNTISLCFLPPDQVYSYLYGASLRDNQPTTMRKNMSVCIYNGHIKPDQALNNEPAKSFWR